MSNSDWAKFMSNLSIDRAFNEAGTKPSPADHWTSGRRHSGLSTFTSAESGKSWLSRGTKPE